MKTLRPNLPLLRTCLTVPALLALHACSAPNNTAPAEDAASGGTAATAPRDSEAGGSQRGGGSSATKNAQAQTDPASTHPSDSHGRGGTSATSPGATDSGGSSESQTEVTGSGGKSTLPEGGRPNASDGVNQGGLNSGMLGGTNSGGKNSSGGKSNSGSSVTGGAATGGSRTTVTGTTGLGTGGATTATSLDSSIPMTIPTPSNGQGEIRSGTTILKNARNGGKDVWDFENQRIGVNNQSDCDDGEDQITVFEVEDGVTVRNLIIAGGLAAGNGIVCNGNCTLEHVYWEDVCEDAATNSKDGATMTLDHVIALHASDKVFQHNAKNGSKTVVKNSYIADFGKLWRSCGDCTANGGPRHLELENVRVESVNITVAGANQNYGDTVTIKNLYVKNGYDAAKDKPKICTEYVGVTDHNGESTKVDGGKSQWNTATCKISQADVKSF